jgi:hypothetical protein
MNQNHINHLNHWGPSNWYWFHLISITSPILFKKNDIKFYNKLIYYMLLLIPCSKCVSDFKNYIKLTIQEKGQFKTRIDFIKFFIDIHNNVNKNNNKPVLDYQDAINLYVINDNYQLKHINHLLLNNYLLYHYERIQLNKISFKLFIKVIEKIIIVHPCNICSNVLKDYEKKHPLINSGYNMDKFTKWFNKFFDNQDIVKCFSIVN